MAAYALSRAAYTLLQEGRYLVFTPVGQNALRRFMRDAYAHVQSLDVEQLASYSTGALSRVFARGMRAYAALLRLLVFNVAPTALEAGLALALLHRRYGAAFSSVALFTVSLFVTDTMRVVRRRVRLLSRANANDNRLFARFFNSLLNNEAVRVNVNEAYEIKRYDAAASRSPTWTWPPSRASTRGRRSSSFRASGSSCGCAHAASRAGSSPSAMPSPSTGSCCSSTRRSAASAIPTRRFGSRGPT
jgi:ABC-type multidrug transport system fused ATPase/permease subunit